VQLRARFGVQWGLIAEHGHSPSLTYEWHDWPLFSEPMLGAQG
jgi:hypothetical protein